jgi:RHS repeat-associated protein
MAVGIERRDLVDPGSSQPPSDRSSGRPARDRDRGHDPDVAAPHVTLPKGGGAISGIGEKFAANALTGTATLTVPLALSPGRAEGTPDVALRYDSGAGNGPFGLGWKLTLPSISRKTEKGLPRYRDHPDEDVFILSETEDLVPALVEQGSGWTPDVRSEPPFRVDRYRPRVEQAFSRIERWTDVTTGDAHWRVTTRDNRTSIFGRSAVARIADPADPRRVFSWLLEQVSDDRGNVIAFVHQAEDLTGVDPGLVSEHSRLEAPGQAQRYLKRIRYGNAAPGDTSSWLFEAVFDYGDHHPTNPAPDPDRPWPVRQDPFSTCRPGFELRTYRLCRRVLMFHRVPELALDPVLVRSTDLAYVEDASLTLLASITQKGHVREGTGYRSRALPALDLAYSSPTADGIVHDVDPDSLANLPIGADGNRYRWLDLDGEGIPGILSEQSDGWFYKRNLGSGRFAPAETLPARPSTSDPGSPRRRVADLAGSGRQAVVELEPNLAGYYERTDDASWTPFTLFREVPNLDWTNPDLRLVDVDGDGLADVLIVDDQAVTWFPSLGHDGYGAPTRLAAALDEERGPALVFADGTESIFLADMSGDGLSDLVRIRNADVAYWPNLGYGRFGARVTMANAPVLDAPDDFEQRRLRLIDIDGTGTTDLVYLGAGGVLAARNLAGNAWSDPVVVAPAPAPDGLARVTVADLLGSGTACLVWSAPPALPAPAMRYLDLVGGVKPYLLASISNNQGATTTLAYAPSTKFFLADRAAGQPWATRLPFPVHVLERVTVTDGVTGASYVTTYRYHHGFYDGVEREFRGFGSVEQLDADTTSAALGQGEYTQLPPAADGRFTLPPVLTRTWFHVGAFFEESRLEGRFATEFDAGDPLAPTLAEAELPSGLSADEEREAVRALRARTLRTEIYALDGTPSASRPYMVMQAAAGVRLLQPRAGNRFAAFLTVDRETLSHHYERNSADPRVTHDLTLEVDAYGNVTRSARAAYPRRAPDIPEQAVAPITVAEADFINHDGDPAFYRLGLVAERRTYELTGARPAGPVFTVPELRPAVAAAVEIPFEAAPAPPAIQRRPLDRTRTLYYRDDLSGPLPLGQVESHALPYQTYRLAFTPSLLTTRFANRVTPAVLTGEGGYVSMDGDLWATSGRRLHEPAAFLQPAGSVDPFGNTITAVFDAHGLALVQTADPLGNTATAELNYRTLQPWRMTDANGNRSGVRFDECGWVIATAALGKVDGDADRLDLSTPEPAASDDPTTRLEYRLDQWATGLPNYVHTSRRERHGDPATPWQETYVYTDGLGREALTKAPADPGPAPARDASGALVRNPDGSLVMTQVDRRWVGSGRTVFDNKGNPVKRYEPFFDSLPVYEGDDALRAWGVATVVGYDPLGRATRTDAPDGTYSKVVFDAWGQATWDGNDTVLDSRWYADRQALPATDPGRRAADAAAAHARTPAVTKLDVLGRAVRAIADLGGGSTLETRTVLDVLGNQLAVIDPAGITVLVTERDLLGRPAHTVSADAGERYALADVLDRPQRAVDARDHLFTWSYDALGRRTHLFVETPPGPRTLLERAVYGEANPAAATLNLRTRPHLAFDGAGLRSSDRYDLDGNLAQTSRRVPTDATVAPDWSALAGPTDLTAILAAANPTLENEVFGSATAFDALARPVSLITPDGSITTVGYGRSGRLSRVDAAVRGAAPAGFVVSTTYNARGQREVIRYGNGTSTTSLYDPLTFRLARLTTSRAAPAALQDLGYTYDPVGNVCEVSDAAQQTVFFDNAMVPPDQRFTYDAIYRLMGAGGREHVGQGANPLPNEYDWADGLRVNLPQPGDGQALRAYQESYTYDAAGNLALWKHTAGPTGSWTRRSVYDAASHRLLGTSLPGDGPAPPYSGAFSHDPDGNVTKMPFLPALGWNALDRLESIDLGGGGSAHYQYDAEGRRTRKLVARVGGLVEERIYLDGYEVHRRRTTSLQMERQSLHLMDGVRRLAIVETKTVDVAAPPGAPASLVRYQLDNHLGSACVELDAAGAVISYEEYYPFGSTSYQAGPSGTAYSLKRYRYTGVERDDETGLSYHAARYCAPWLGRWISPDPDGLADGTNLYVYARNNPAVVRDPSGRQGQDDPPQPANTPARSASEPAGTLIETVPHPPTEPEKRTPGDANLENLTLGNTAGGATGGKAGELTQANVLTVPSLKGASTGGAGTLLAAGRLHLWEGAEAGIALGTGLYAAGTDPPPRLVLGTFHLSGPGEKPPFGLYLVGGGQQDPKTGLWTYTASGNAALTFYPGRHVIVYPNLILGGAGTGQVSGANVTEYVTATALLGISYQPHGGAHTYGAEIAGTISAGRGTDPGSLPRQSVTGTALVFYQFGRGSTAFGFALGGSVESGGGGYTGFLKFGLGVERAAPEEPPLPRPGVERGF